MTLVGGDYYWRRDVYLTIAVIVVSDFIAVVAFVAAVVAAFVAAAAVAAVAPVTIYRLKLINLTLLPAVHH